MMKRNYIVRVIDCYDVGTIGDVLEAVLKKAGVEHIRKPGQIWAMIPCDPEIRGDISNRISDISYLCGYRFRQADIEADDDGVIRGYAGYLEDGCWTPDDPYPTAFEDFSEDLQEYILKVLGRSGEESE